MMMIQPIQKSGSQLEMQYSLLSFGIPCQILLPVINKNKNRQSNSSTSRGSEIHNNNNKQTDKHRDGINIAARQLHQIYIQNRRESERQESENTKYLESETGIIYYPQEDDVIMGRGRPYQEHKGNIRFGKVIDSYLEEYYKQTDRFAKTCISMKIVKQVQDYGGRFLERHMATGAWRIIDDLAAREKTSIGFRSRSSKVAAVATATDKPDSTVVVASSSSSYASGGGGGGGGDNASRSQTSSSPSNTTVEDFQSTKEAKRFRYDPSVVAR